MFRAMMGLLAALAIGTAVQAKPQDMYATNNGVKIHYVVDGNGPLVVLIHGFPDYWGTWKPLMAELNKAGYRTAALDTRGYNLSDKPEGEAAYAMPNLIGDVAAVIAAEGQKSAIIVGHDWGAAISWQVVFNRPDLVNKLVIMSVPHPVGFAREMATNVDQQKNSQYARNFQQPGFEKNLSAAGLASMVAGAKDTPRKAEYLEAFQRSNLTSMMNYYRANYPRGTGDAVSPPSGITAASPPMIKVPVLVIHGMKDTALNAAGHAGTWNYVAEDSTILMIPGAGHFVQHDAEALVNKTVRSWLNDRR